MIANGSRRHTDRPSTNGITYCAAAANVTVNPAPSAHRYAASGLTVTRGREFCIDAFDAALCLSRPSGLARDAIVVAVHDRLGARTNELRAESFGNILHEATGDYSAAFANEATRYQS